MDGDNDAADSENTELGKEEEYDDDDGEERMNMTMTPSNMSAVGWTISWGRSGKEQRPEEGDLA